MVEQPAPQAWDDFVCARGGHLLQSARWGQLKTHFGWSVLRLALERDGQFVAGAQMLFRRMPFGLNVAYIPRGPLADPSDPATLDTLLDVLSAKARQHGAFALKLEPDWQSSSPAWQILSTATRGQASRLLTMGRVGMGVQPRTTVHVNLTRDLDTILARMKPKWRYNIRLAQRKGITVRKGMAADLETFYALLRTTGLRDRFAIHSFDYYSAVFDLLGEHACLLIAEYEGEPLAAIFITAFGGESIYLYGASSNAHRDRMPNHALHWEAMQWAKARGCTRYDLWGIPDVAAASPGRGEARFGPDALLPDGLYQFKQGFGGEIVRYVGAYDLVFSTVRFALYTQALRIRRGSALT